MKSSAHTAGRTNEVGMKVLSGGNSDKTPGRNDPCTCGSGLKYKKCCWEKDANHSLSPSPTTVKSLNAQGFDPVNIRMEMQAMMGQIKDIIENKGLSLDDANSYFSGRTMDEIADEAREFKRTPQAEALELAYQGYQVRSRKESVLLAQRALELDPNCAEAFLLLEQGLANNEMDSIDLFQKAIVASETSLGKEFFTENAGHFWGLHETRAFMRAKLGLAQALWSCRRQSEGIEICWELLKLNPNDNQGVRYILFDYLLADSRLKEIPKLIKMFDDEASTHWEFDLALFEFKKDGTSSTAAKTHLREADKSNKYVRQYFSGKLKLPSKSPSHYSPGSKEEAICYIENSAGPWLNTEGAVQWMMSLGASDPGNTPQKQKKQKRKGR